MFAPEEHQLVDFGEGRRLERFGPVLLDRPWPAVEEVGCARPELWSRADARFDEDRAKEGRWTVRRPLPETWTVRHGGLVFELGTTPFGQVGLFAEQAENWDWIAGQLGADGWARPPRVLNLFAYTGGSTLAAAACGAEVVHVDAARNLVAWARRNAGLSGLAERPVRWIVEDAVKFCKRELRRGNRYDAVILDPPSYGHGPHGEVWRLVKHLGRLLALCGELTAGRRRFAVLSCHTPGYHADRLAAMIAEAFGDDGAGELGGGPLLLRAADGRAMPVGTAVRWRARAGQGEGVTG